ncbi:hypothetical protein LRS13_14585 [Svornostia abyssi]|uniref:DUF4158 domain-containing protein n=1 Tax=Svornostia abyssi TaxID=2898438 RepID=A0ABY5PBP1_9ACTN|nr:hypothetical protein LRS13_14585 [Parviterribacteraceae bacterium J379]
MEIRRYPHLTPEDAEILRGLDPKGARDFERLLKRQHASDRRYRTHHTGVEPDALERAAGRRRYGDGVGGGRRSPRHAAA